MSYILDALKKSEKERQKKNVPDLLTIQDPVLNEKRKRRVWPYVLIAVLLVNIGFWGYLLGQKNIKKAETNDTTVQQQNELKTPESQKTESAKNEMPAKSLSVQQMSQLGQMVKEKPIPAVSIQQKKPLSEKAGNEHPVREEAIIQSVKSPIEKETQNVQAKTASKDHGSSAEASVPHEEKPAQTVTPPPVQGKIYTTSELPQTIQQSLPSVNVSIFMYSDDPASRMVRINGQTYREGQKISEDLKLERITPNGIILDYRNYRFQVGQQHP
jgi:general secretion pathway protein B